MSNLQEIMKAINKKHKKDIMILGNEAKERAFIPFSSPRANYMTRGGVAQGKMIEFSGAGSGGKTTTAIDIMKNFQSMFPDRGITYLDAENTFDDEYAEKLGVNMREVLMIKPEAEHGDLLLEMVMDTVKSGDIGLFIVDSVPFLRSKQEMEGALEDKTYAGNSDLMTRFCGKIIPLMNKFNTTALMLNQIRAKMGVHYTAYNYPGGYMYHHSCSQRIFFRKGNLLNEEYKEQTSAFENPVGHIVELKFLKNKVNKPDRNATHYTLNYTDGIDYMFDTIDLGVDLGVIVQGGSWFSWNGEQTQGKFKMLDKMRNDPEKFALLHSEVMERAVQ